MQRFEFYVEKSSLIHRLDPRTKIIWALGTFFLTMTFNDPRFLGLIFVTIIMTGIIAKIPISRFIFVFKAISLLVLFALILWPLFIKGGNVLITVSLPFLGQLVYTQKGVLFGLAIAFRIISMISISFIVLMTTKINDIALGLVKMKMPYKGGFIISTAFRFVPTLYDETLNIIDAQRARGLELERGNIIRKIKNYIPIFSPLLIRFVRLTQQLALSMESRAFGAKPKRTFLRELHLSKLDYSIIILILAFEIIAISGRIMGYGVMFPEYF